MMKSLFFLALFVLIAARPMGGWAQNAPPSAVPPLSAAEAQRALDVLQDPRKREQLIAVLRAIARAAPAPTAANPPAEPAEPADAAKTTPGVTLKPNSLGAQLLVALSGWSVRLAGEVSATLQTMNNLPALWRWFIELETDPQASLMVAVAAGWLALVFGCALLLEFATSGAL